MATPTLVPATAAPTEAPAGQLFPRGCVIFIGIGSVPGA